MTREEAIKVIKDNWPEGRVLLKLALEFLIPELKESDDERIRKSIIDLVEKQMPKSENKKWMIAWLEKQGEQKPQGKLALEVWKDMRLEVYQQASGNRHEPNYSDDSTKMFSLTDIDEIIEKVAEKQCEQKNTNKIKPRFKVGDTIRPKGSMAEYTIESIYGECYHGKGWRLTIGCDEDYELVEQKPTDKVEPKFKVGDWIVEYNNVNTINQVIKVEQIDDEYFGYTLDDKSYFGGSWESSYRLWTIKDAKDGDVLYECNEKKPFIFKELKTKHIGDIASYCDIFNGVFNPNEDNWTTLDIVPATKEQCDLLFSKMKEAGYEWDAEKKELKKIEQKSKEKTKFYNSMDDLIADALIEEIENSELDDRGKHNRIVWIKSHRQKPTWSEEDEEKQIDTIKYLEIFDAQGIHGNVALPCINWLKSLKERYTWKPSDEQMEALLKLEEMHVLEHEKNQENAHLYMVIKSLKEQLLKLKGE